ncbi:UNVERIFIED_ORG: hypothetical protein GGE64_000067 [Rhizobium etli]
MRRNTSLTNDWVKATEQLCPSFKTTILFEIGMKS